MGMKRLRSSLSHAIARVRGSACSGATADRGPDGLPLLPWHLTYQTHYDPKEHCPVCSLGAWPAVGGLWPGTAAAAADCLRMPRPTTPLLPRPAGEGEAHEPGKTQSHAAHYMALPPPPQPALTSVDEHGLKLMMSLQRPRGWPTWWGPQRAELQARCARALESTPLHWTIIALTVFDLGIVVTGGRGRLRRVLPAHLMCCEAVPLCPASGCCCVLACSQHGARRCSHHRVHAVTCRPVLLLLQRWS